MRVSIRHAFVQPAVTWDVLEPRLRDSGLSEKVVANVRAACPEVRDVCDENLSAHGIGTRRVQRILGVVKQTRDQVQQADRSALVQLMGRSRGWVYGTRAKLYLTLLWKQQLDELGADPVSIDEYVKHLGVDRRSVNQALRDLDAGGFVTLSDFWDRRPRKDSESRQPVAVRGQHVELRSDLGDGSSYQRPTSGGFFQIGTQLWTDGWMPKLSGQGLAVLLVLLSRLDSQDPTGPIWVATSQVKGWYGFSPKVWQNGVEDLSRLKLIRTRKIAADTTADKPISHRKLYTPDGLAHPWLVPAAPDPAQAEGTVADRGQAIPERAQVLYLRQNEKLGVTLRSAVHKLRVEYEIAQTPIERYDAARELVRFAGRELSANPDCEQTQSLLQTWARIQISHSPDYLSARKKKQPRRDHEGYRYLVELLEADHDYDQALALATEARQHGWGRTRAEPASWDKTIKRLERAARRKAAEADLHDLSDQELFSPDLDS